MRAPLKYLKQLPVQLVLSILMALGLGRLLDLYTVSAFYTLSSFFIDILMFFLPIMVFSFIFRALVNINRGSALLVLLVFIGVTISNCTALSLAYLFGHLTLPWLGLGATPEFAHQFASQVEVLYSLNLQPFIGAEIALMLGIVSGLFISFLKDDTAFKILSRRWGHNMSHIITLVLRRAFVPIIPLYVFGFCLKLSYDNALVHLFSAYGKVFLVSMVLVVGYLSMLYFTAAKGNLSRMRQYLSRMMPAGLTGFSTMSSAASLPLVLEGTKENTQDENFSNLVIPATSNIHMLGDDLTIIMTCLALMSVFGMPWIEPWAFIPFALAFSVAKLSCVGVPGASVLVVLPVLQSHLGFSPEMISLLTTIYVLQDPFGTTANVMGNGAFALILQRMFKRLQRLPVPAKS